MLSSFTASCYIKRKKINNEGVGIDGFQSSSLMTAWEEVFSLCRELKNVEGQL